MQKPEFDIETIRKLGLNTYFNDLKFAKENAEECSTYFLEFTKDSIENIHPWKEDSIYMYGEIFDALGLNKIFREVVPEFDFYDNTLVSVEKWNELYKKSRTMDQNVMEVFAELKVWVDECLEQQGDFVIRGM